MLLRFVTALCLFPPSIFAQLDTRSFDECVTSETDSGNEDGDGKLATTCQFPFILNKKTYWACTFDYGHLTGYKPWCSTKVDENRNHIQGEWGICDDTFNCPIPPRRCGEPVSTRKLPDSGKSERGLGITQLPWMVALGIYDVKEGDDVIEVNPRTGVRFAEEFSGFTTRSEFEEPCEQINKDLGVRSGSDDKESALKQYAFIDGKCTKWVHQCGGSLITNRHILSAAHCFDYGYNFTVRMGTADMQDIIGVRTGDQVGAIERKVVKHFQHPKYRAPRAYYDAAIAVVDRVIEFTDYVRPVCLPMTPVDDEDAAADDLVTLAGWGLNKAETGEWEQTEKLKLKTLQVSPKSLCAFRFSREELKKKGVSFFQIKRQLTVGFTNDVSCVGNDFKEKDGSCDGDSGSPVIKRISGTARDSAYFEQHYIVASGVTCKMQASLFTRVANREILTWIQAITSTAPLLMVVGGYNGSSTLNDVELISHEGKNCVKQIRPIQGIQEELEDGSIVNDAAAFGHTGIFAKDAPRVCGGKNHKGNLDKCYELNTTINAWTEMKEMREERYYATTVLNDDGNMWVMGGYAGNNPKKATEIFKYKAPPRKGRWKKGKPLPADLRDSGIESHCSFALNKTHIFMAGGYAKPYDFVDRIGEIATPDDVTEDDCDILDDPTEGIDLSANAKVTIRSACDAGIVKPQKSASRTRITGGGGGFAINRSWMFDGYYWVELANMFEVRDRPACSLLNKEDGQIRILVAGGCDRWCVKRRSAKTHRSAEMYNPETDQWTQVRDMPVALHSAKMELLNGIPTLIGGYNTETRKANKKLYQYFEKEDEWRTLDIELKNARFSHTVFPVPHHLFSEACGNGLAVNPNLKDPLVGEDPGQFLTTPNEKVNPDVDYEELDLTSFFKVTIRSGDEDEKEENKPDKRCQTKKGQNCKFPFTYQDATYNGCPIDPFDPNERWCSTKTDRDGNHINGAGNYGFCEDDCPKYDTRS